MHPILLRIPLWGGNHFDIATYGVMMMLGVLAGVFLASRIAKREGVSPVVMLDLAFWAVISGIVGAKLWHIIQHWNPGGDNSDLFRNFRSGLVFYGGFLGGAVGSIIFLRIKRLPIMKILDILAPALIIGLAFGRVGCFFNGCCYGRQSDSCLAVSFVKVTDGDTLIGSPAFMDQL